MFVSTGNARGARAITSLPIERLEAEITTLAGHLSAAMCRWLALVAEFERREGHIAWGCASCAQWLAWRCGITPGTAREQLRVARRLAELPATQDAFASGRLSFSQVRALSRVATPDNEHNLLELAATATAAQLERIVRGYRKADDLAREEQAAHRAREVFWFHDDDGSVVIQARLPAAEGELVLSALASAESALTESDGEDAAPDDAADPDDLASDDSEDVSAETPVTRAQRRADALVAMAETTLAAGVASLAGGERHAIVVHVDHETLAADEPGRCELADGTAIAPETARRMACDAAVVRMREGKGRPLDVGRRTRTIPPAIRRALASRDGGCRFPGCTHRRFVDAHHIHHWAHGGRTSVENLVLLCRHHHRLVHEGGFSMERRARGDLVFRRPDGRRLPVVCRPLTGKVAELSARHARAGVCIGADKATSRWAGDRLDLPLTTSLLLGRHAPRERDG